MQLERFKFEITGVSPLLMDNAESMEAPKPDGLRGAKKNTQAGNLVAKMYVDAKGNLYIPAVAFRIAVISGSKGRRIGKMGAASVIKGAFFPVGDEAKLFSPKTKKPLTPDDTIIDTRSAVNNNCKPPARIITSRPRLNEWACVLEVEIDTMLVSIEVVTEILLIAGKMIGVGAFRVENDGIFGRFDAKLIK